MNTITINIFFNKVKKNAWGINNITQRHGNEYMPAQSELLSVFLGQPCIIHKPLACLEQKDRWLSLPCFH